MSESLLRDWAAKREPAHRAKHAAKLSAIRLEEIRPIAGYKFRNESGDVLEAAAVAVRVATKGEAGGADRFHNVVIGLKPGATEPAVWCGDHALKGMFPQEESPCEFWKKAKIQNGYCCKHIQAALTWIANDPGVADETEAKLRSVLPEPQSFPEPESEIERDARVTLSAGLPVLFFGPTGSGKSWLAAKLIEKSGRKPFHIHISDGLEDLDLLQKLIPSEDGKGWRRLPGELTQAFSAAQDEPVIVLLEEVTRSSKSLRNMLIHVLDRKGDSYWLHNWTSGRHYKVAIDRIHWIGTANLGAGYSDANEIDPALLRRFGSALMVDYDAVAETRLLNRMGLESGMAASMVSVASQLRTQFREGRLPRPVDTASLLDWGRLIQAGMAPLRAAQCSWINRVAEMDRHGYPEPGHVSVIQELIAKEITTHGR